MKTLNIFQGKSWIFLSLILIVLSFRLYHLDYPILDAFNFRQAQTATIALNFFKNGINLFQTELDIFGIGKERYLTLEFPLYEAIVAMFYKIFFVSDIWGRIVSILSGFIGAWYLYRLVNLLVFDRKIAFFSSFFFLFAPLNMFYQRSFMIEPFVIALLLAGIYYFCHFVNYEDKKSYFFSIIFLTLGFIHKGLYGPFWLLPMIVFYARKRSIRMLFSPEFLIILSVPLLSLFFWQRYVNNLNMLSGHFFFTTTDSSHLEWNFGFLSDRFLWSMWKFRLQQVLNGIFLKPGLLIFLIGLLVVKKIDKNGFLFNWLFSQIIYFVVLFRIQQQNYYQTIMVPAFSVFMSIGLINLAHWLNLMVKKFSDISYLRIYLSPVLLSIFCSLFIYKSWINTKPSFYIDWEWYRRLRVVGQFLSNDSYGILVTPGYDWNSVYTYIPRKKMLLVSLEELTPEHILTWQKDGYSFIVLHEPEKYRDYLLTIKPGYTLDFLKRYKRILFLQEFEVYTLK